MVQDDEFQEINIKVLKFVETNENDEFSKQKIVKQESETKEKEKERVKEDRSPCI